MIRYFLYVVITLIAMLASMLALGWWSPAFTNATGNLPSGLYWQQTFDATLDEGWKNGYYPATWGASFSKRYLARMLWLYRNNCYALQYFQLGSPFDSAQWTIVRSDGTVFYATGPDGMFSFEYGGRFGTYKLGWKAFNYTTPADRTKWMPPEYMWGPLKRVPVCFTINPFSGAF